MDIWFFSFKPLQIVSINLNVICKGNVYLLGTTFYYYFGQYLLFDLKKNDLKIYVH